MEQLQFEADSETDDKKKKDKMAKYKTKQAEVEALEVEIDGAEEQKKELKRTMRQIKDDAMVRDANLKAAKANAEFIVAIKRQ